MEISRINRKFKFSSFKKMKSYFEAFPHNYAYITPNQYDDYHELLTGKKPDLRNSILSYDGICFIIKP